MSISIGIIIDGNRRWAKGRGLNAWDGHREGAKTVRECIRWAKDRGDISDLFFYTLSTENWKRPHAEIEYLLLLIEQFFRVHVDELAGEGVRIRVVGQRERFAPRLQKIFADIEERTATHTGMTVSFGLSYGGRAEIVDGVNTAIQQGTPVTEAEFKKLLWTANIPDQDIIVRTGGEKRLSNFLTWSSVYSELFFVDTHWPAFSKEEFYSILDTYTSRQRRMGK